MADKSPMRAPADHTIEKTAEMPLEPERRNSPENDRRSRARHTRTTTDASAASAGAAGPGTRHFLIPAEWCFMAPAFAIGFCVMGLASHSLPEWRVTILGLSAMIVSAASPLFSRLERKVARTYGQRLAAMTTAVVLPMLLFSLAILDWTGEASNAPATAVIGVLAMISALSSVLLNARLPAMATAMLALWCPAAATVNTPTAWLIFAFGVCLVAIALISQQDIERARRRHDIEIRRRQLRAEEILADYEQTGQGWFWETDRRGLITYVSETVGQVLRQPVTELVGRPLAELFVLDADSLEGERTLNFHLSAKSGFNDLALRAACPCEERWWSVTGRPIHDVFNNFMGFRGSGSDLTEMRRSQQNETRLAHYDSLTSLANRFQMSQTLEKILHAPNFGNRACAIFLLDLDRFKQVNDTMGHPVGDALLQQAAQRLQWTVGDAARVGRLGGDEFQIVLPGRFSRDELAGLAANVIRNVSQPYVIDNHRVIIGVSIGIAIAPEDGITSETLIRNADLALYAAKDSGRGRHHFYDPGLHSDAEERRRLEADLRDAVAHGGLELHYQPVVHTTTERITGFEALLRWNHPQKGSLSPSRFIPIAEDAGLISQIGEWALRTACHDLAGWPETVRVAVNVSPLQFANPSLPAIVTSALAQAQVSPDRLELEITESVFLNDDEGTEAMFAALKRVGVRLALDDFGTGYSSLGYLRKAPFDKIKIDQSFVHGATIKGSRNGAIIASIVSLAESLGMETTAEGVETLDELELVRMLGCSHVQGFIYEKPLNAAAAAQRLTLNLVAIAQGPRSSRPARQTMLRKVVLEHDGQFYDGTIRNISRTGALVEGLWNVPPGTVLAIHLAHGSMLMATARWCRDDRMGMEFAVPLPVDSSGRAILASPHGARAQGNSSRSLRKAAG